MQVGGTSSPARTHSDVSVLLLLNRHGEFTLPLEVPLGMASMALAAATQHARNPQSQAVYASPEELFDGVPVMPGKRVERRLLPFLNGLAEFEATHLGAVSEVLYSCRFSLKGYLEVRVSELGFRREGAEHWLTILPPGRLQMLHATAFSTYLWSKLKEVLGEGGAAALLTAQGYGLRLSVRQDESGFTRQVVTPHEGPVPRAVLDAWPQLMVRAVRGAGERGLSLIPVLQRSEKGQAALHPQVEAAQRFWNDLGREREVGAWAVYSPLSAQVSGHARLVGVLERQPPLELRELRALRSRHEGTLPLLRDLLRASE